MTLNYMFFSAFIFSDSPGHRGEYTNSTVLSYNLEETSYLIPAKCTDTVRP